ncbi:hypothetical protein MRX96_014666 [Rhipicephalus microplus]
MKTLLMFALALLAVTKSFSTVANAGWRIHDPFSNPKFLQLAHYALTRQPNGGWHSWGCCATTSSRNTGYLSGRGPVFAQL